MRNINESYSFDNVEGDYFFQESDDIDRIKNKIAECAEEISELEAMLKKNPNNVTKEILLEDAKKRMRRWKNELEELDEDAVKPSNNSTFKPNIRYDASTGMNIFTINKNTQNESEFNKIYEICKKMKTAVNDKQWSSFESNASMFYKEINISDYESRRMMLNTIDKNCIQIWFTNAETKVNPTNMRFFHCSHTSSHVELKPTHVNAANTIIYPCNAVFFIAINKSDNIDKILSNFKMYGENVYEYIPSRDDIIYTDSKERRENRIPAVFIKTNKPLKVNKYQIKTSLESYSFDSINDDYFSESVYSFDKTLDTCKELHKCWSKFNYGIPINGRIYSVRSAREFCDKYRFLSPEEFEKYGGGVCWDFVEWGAKFLRDKGVSFHQYYIQTDTPPNYDTHTFIVCKCGNKFVYPEYVFGTINEDINGVGVFNSLPEIYNYIASMMFKSNGNNRRFNNMKFVVKEFTQTPNYGCTNQEYMDFINKHSRPIFKGYVGNKNITKEYFVEYVHHKVDQYIQDNFDIIQEASNKTKTRRMKNKILKSVNADKYGNATISNGDGENVDINISFSNNQPSCTGVKYDLNKGKPIRTIHMNTNHLKRKNGTPAFNHEKNHILIDSRKNRETVTRSDGVKEYKYYFTNTKDISYEKLAKAFIAHHNQEIMSEHSRNVDEYMSDLYTAEDVGFSKVMKMLQDLQGIIGSNNSPSAKYQINRIKKNATKFSEKYFFDHPDELMSLYNDYIKSIKVYEGLLERNYQIGGNPNDEKRLSNIIKTMKDGISTIRTFIDIMIDKKRLDKIEKDINEYNSDLKLRIEFLKDMKKLKESKKSIEPYLVKESSNCISDLFVKCHNECYDNNIKKENETINIIHEYVNNILDHSFYTENDIDDIINDVYAYFVIESVEKENDYTTYDRTILESKLSKHIRDNLDDSDFGIPEKRTYPLNDKNHVEAAVRMFPHADDSDKEELARRILRKAHHFGMDTSKWDLNKYIQEDAFEPIHLDEIVYTTASAGYKPEVPDESQINPFVSFDKVPLNDFIINRYKPKTDDFSFGLKHLHMNDNSKGFLWLNQKDDVVGYVCVDYPNITMIELSPNYQHKGLGRKLLNFATDYLGGRNLCVSKRNENAIKMFKHCGWNVCDETTNMCLLNKTDKE